MQDPIDLDRRVLAATRRKLSGFSSRPVDLEADRAFLQELYLTCHQSEVPGIDPAMLAPLMSQQSDLQLSQYALDFPEARHWLLLRKGEPVGRLILAEVEDTTWIVDLGLLPERRSKGWGGTLVRALRSEAGRAGRHLGGYVFVENQDGRRFWRRESFTEGATEGLHVRIRWASPTAA